MDKTYTLRYPDGSGQEYGSKKTAVKHGDASGKDYQVLSPTGQLVADVKVPTPNPEPVKQPEGVEKTPESTVESVALKHVISRTLPGNYSIITAPGVVAMAEAYGGLVAQEVRFTGKLERRVDISSNNKAQVEKFGRLVDESLEAAHAGLRSWQKEDIERRRGLTDMQRYLEHRDYLAGALADVAKAIESGELR